MYLGEVPTPALVVDRSAFDHNVARIGETLPGSRLRPHVKAFKSTTMAALLADAGHTGFCCATVREMIGLSEAGLGDDLLLANEVVDPVRLERLAALEESGARITVALDSDETVDAAAAAGLSEALIDINVGMPRCGCEPSEAGRLAERARSAGIDVRGVMGYEGHIVGNPDRAWRERMIEVAMEALVGAHEAVGGEVVSAGGTGTYDINRWATEIQAGSFVLMDTHYDELGLGFRQGLFLLATVLTVRPEWSVADGGLKALGMDHGDPSMSGAQVFFCSDEHLTFIPDVGRTPSVGDRVVAVPAHIDPTIARHERLYVVDRFDADLLVADGDIEVVDEWPVDLRHW